METRSTPTTQSVMSMSVGNSVSMSARISQKAHVQTSNFLCMFLWLWLSSW